MLEYKREMQIFFELMKKRLEWYQEADTGTSQPDNEEGGSANQPMCWCLLFNRGFFWVAITQGVATCSGWVQVQQAGTSINPTGWARE
jgi:hypothetical protein